MMGRLHVRVQPAARSTKWAGWFGELPKLAVAEPAVGGAANEAVVAVLARALDVTPRSVRLVGGARGRTKRFEIDGVDEAALLQRIVEINPRPPARDPRRLG